MLNLLLWQRMPHLVFRCRWLPLRQLSLRRTRPPLLIAVRTRLLQWRGAALALQGRIKGYETLPVRIAG